MPPEFAYRKMNRIEISVAEVLRVQKPHDQSMEADLWLDIVDDMAAMFGGDPKFDPNEFLCRCFGSELSPRQVRDQLVLGGI